MRNLLNTASKAITDKVPGIDKRCSPGLGKFISIFFTLRESRRTPDPALPRIRSTQVHLHPWRLGSEALQLLQHWGLDNWNSFSRIYSRLSMTAKQKRKSIRLPGYDYSQAGAYFVGVCTKERKCLLGDINDKEMV